MQISFFYRFRLLILLSAIFVLVRSSVISQVPTVQDCAGAIAICQNIYSETNAYSGMGNYPNEIDTVLSCLKQGEKNDVWYTFTVQQGGQLCFTITPNNAADDYDWAVYNLSNANCSDIAVNGALEVSCNFSPALGPTGPNDQAGAQNNPCISVSSGQIYVVNVSQFTVSVNGYTVDFSASTATVFDDVNPTLSSVDPISCAQTSITFTFSENVLCNTVQNGDFSLSGPGGPYTLSNVTGANCSVGGQTEKTFTADISPPIGSGGSFNLCLTGGSGITDLCGNVAPASCLPITVQGLNVTIININNVNCFGAKTGSATASVSGGTAPYTYQWSTTPQQTDVTATGLGGGIYNVTATDVTGCSGTASVAITAPSVVISPTNVSCDSASCDGSATATPNGGTSPYSFQWYDVSMVLIPGATNPTILNLCAGAYCVVTTDANNCVDTTCLTIIIPDVVIASITTGCPGFCDGSAFVASLGGTPPFTYEWQNPLGTPIPGETDSVLENQCAGKYYLQITTSTSCVFLDSVTITDPLVLSGTISGKNACFGVCDGTVTLVASGGTPPYTYTWNDPDTQKTATATGLCAGSYSVAFTDSKGCGPDSATLSISQNSDITLTTSVVPDSCNTKTGEGVASVVVFGGATPYTYKWSDPGLSTGQSASGLVAGSYTVTVTDSSLCTDTATVTIAYADSNQATISVDKPVSCAGLCDGELSVTVLGGQPPYTFAWSTKEVTQTVDSICPDTTYTVSATDTSGCPANATVVLTAPDSLRITGISKTDETTCNAKDGAADLSVTGGTPPYTYTWSNGATSEDLTGLAPGTYTIIVTDSNNCPADSDNVTINAAPPLTASITKTDETTCNAKDGTATLSVDSGVPPYIIVWKDPALQTNATATGLAPGTYWGTFTDANNCPLDSLSITINAAPLITFSVSIKEPTCFGFSDGTATVINIAGGIAPYSFAWSDANSQSQETATSLGKGTYFVTVSDPNNCTVQSQPIIISEPAPIDLTLASTCINGEGAVDAFASGGTPPYSYLWSHGATTASVTGLAPGNYSLTVTDANNCPPQQESVFIAPCTITVPTAFTPNGNGINDNWNVKNLEYYPDCIVKIYNRWGDLVFRSNGYDEPWDGTKLGVALPTAVYYYLIENVDVKFFVEGSKPQGYVVIMRKE